MEKTDKLFEIVADLNSRFGSDTFIAAELLWSESNYYIKFYGEIIWHEDNCGLDYVKEPVWTKVNEIIKPVEQAYGLYLKDQVMYTNLTKEALEEMFTEEGL